MINRITYLPLGTCIVLMFKYWFLIYSKIGTKGAHTTIKSYMMLADKEQKVWALTVSLQGKYNTPVCSVNCYLASPKWTAYISSLCLLEYFSLMPTWIRTSFYVKLAISSEMVEYGWTIVAFLPGLYCLHLSILFVRNMFVYPLTISHHSPWLWKITFHRFMSTTFTLSEQTFCWMDITCCNT